MSESEPEVTTEPTPEGEPEVTTTPTAEGEPEVTTEPTSEGEPEVTTEPTAESEPEVTTEPTAEGEPEVTTEPTAEGEPEVTTEPTAEGEPEVTTEPTAEGEPEVTTEPIVEGEPEVTTEPTLRGEPEVNMEPTGEGEPEITTEPKSENELETIEEPTADAESRLINLTDENGICNITNWLISEPEIGSPEVEAREEPTTEEILLPPIFLLLSGVFLILFLYLMSHRKRLFHKTERQKWKKIKRLEFSYLCKESAMSMDDISTFMTERDDYALESLKHFQNNASGLCAISVAPALSLFFCPLTLFMYTPITKMFWPEENEFAVAPNINDAIGCFLVPAGMVYAITFGFAFQKAYEKHSDIDSRLQKEICVVGELFSICYSLNWLNKTSMLQILHTMKAELVNRILFIQKFDDLIIPVNLWDIIGFVRGEPSKTRSDIDKAAVKEILRCLRTLHSLKDECQIFHSRMHPFQWLFLEMLGYFSFMGILLIQAKSYRMELAMCIVIVVSISLLCYVVGDLDSPFHGFFKVDLTILSNMVKTLERTAHCLKCPSEVELLQTDGLHLDVRFGQVFQSFHDVSVLVDEAI